MNGWLKAAGVGKRSAVETSLLSQEREFEEGDKESKDRKWNSNFVCRQLRGLQGRTTWSMLSASKASSMLFTGTQREGERSSCWRRRGRQRRSRGPSFLAPRCEDCMWEEAVHKKEGIKQGVKQNVWCVKRHTYIHPSKVSLSLLSCAAQPDDAAGAHPLPARCPLAGADGAPDRGLRIPASPLRRHGESPGCGAERVCLHHSHLQHWAQHRGTPPLRAGVQRQPRHPWSTWVNPIQGPVSMWRRCTENFSNL